MNRFKFKKYLFAATVIGVGTFSFAIFQNCSSTKFASTESSPSGINGASGTPSTPGGSSLTQPVTPLTLGQFLILGVSGSDNKVGSKLIGERRPTLYWTPSVNAQRYEVSISNLSGVQVCAVEIVTANSFFFSNCSLPDGQYSAQANAFGLGASRSTANFTFTTEASGPSVVIQTPQIAAQDVRIPFAVTPSASTVTSVICTLTGPAGFTTVTNSNCLNQTSQSYTSLPYGPYTYSVVAQDSAGLSTPASAPFEIVAAPCTPLVNYDSTCDKRIKATLYFHINSNGQPIWNSVNTYIEQGINSGTLYFTDLWIPTRSFKSGFPSVSNRTEYFGLDIRTKLKTSKLMPAGTYQIGVLSDDGSIVSTTNSAGVETVLINQDGYTPTKMGCATQSLTLVDNQKINFHVRYFQGPQEAIALVLLYRPWTQATVNSPVNCGAINQDFFGAFPVAVRTDPTDRSYPNTDYASLLIQGWLPVPAGNFSNPDMP